MTTAIPPREPQVLQEYQRRLNEALCDESVDTEAVIAMSIGQQGWLVSLRELSETSICPDLSRTGAMPQGVMGVGNFRGKVYTVLSMPSLCDVLDDETPGPGWATVLHPKFEVPAALWWPRMMGLFPRSDFVRHHHPQSPALCRASWVSADARVWHELDVDRLLKDKLNLSESITEGSNGI